MTDQLATRNPEMDSAARPATSRTALKEWAVACRALGRGDQILLIRKGGISEEHKEFRVEHPEFLLFPTFEHQRAELVKPAAQTELDRTLAERGPTDRVQLRHWAIVAEDFEIREAAELAAIAPLHLWTGAYAEERLRWRPRKPLHALALRVYELAAPITLPPRPEYGGCKSWLTLAEAVVVESARPVLDEAAFAEQVERVRAAVQSARAEVRS